MSKNTNDFKTHLQNYFGLQLEMDFGGISSIDLPPGLKAAPELPEEILAPERRTERKNLLADASEAHWGLGWHGRPRRAPPVGDADFGVASAIMGCYS
jgi:hypothetical protein